MEHAASGIGTLRAFKGRTSKQHVNRIFLTNYFPSFLENQITMYHEKYTESERPSQDFLGGVRELVEVFERRAFLASFRQHFR